MTLEQRRQMMQAYCEGEGCSTGYADCRRCRECYHIFAAGAEHGTKEARKECVAELKALAQSRSWDDQGTHALAAAALIMERLGDA